MLQPLIATLINQIGLPIMTMQTGAVPAPYFAAVSSTADIVSLRQQVRITARDAGVSHAQQAKLAIATSTIAHGVLQHYPNAPWMVRVMPHRGRQVLEVACLVSCTRTPTGSAWADVLPLAVVSELVDEVVIINELGRVMITVRVRLM